KMNPAAPVDQFVPGDQTCFTALKNGGLKAGDTCIIGVVFGPQSLPASSVSAPNMKTQLVVSALTGSPANINLSGNAVSALTLTQVDASNGTVDYGTQGVGTLSGSKNFVATNHDVDKTHQLIHVPTT